MAGLATSSVAGIVAGKNPLEYSESAPYTLFLFQSIFIISLCHIVNIPLRRLQQPRVIAEVVAGILLGPTVMGRIPGFTNRCFPTESIPGLTLMANIGIILFMFILGLEVDIDFIKAHYKVALSVGLVNMAVPFGLGAAIAKGMYDEYSDGDIKFTTYMVFIAVALCITAFPVLARILTELNLIGDRVGTIVLAAGIFNDLIGWILLALVVTLANASNGLNTLYILLITFGWFLFLTYPVKSSMNYLLNRFTPDLKTGEPSQVSMLLIIICVFTSAFFTDIIGVHPIFGAFMVGVIVPRDNGYVIKITEKLEDLVNIVLIPIYFALAGLNTNLGLLDKGIDWAYIIGIILLAMIGKIFGGFISAKANKLFSRESLAVGVLMSCKGIVEIVVLTVGLNANIISQKVYSMFIIMAIVTTFLTTPLALYSYPVSYREKRDRVLKGEINWDGTPLVKENQSADLAGESINKMICMERLNSFKISKLVVLVKKVDTLSKLMHFIYDFASLTSSPLEGNYSVDVKALHLREFNSRTSHLLEVSARNEGEYNEESEFSSILGILKIFTEMMKVHYSSVSLLAPAKNHIFSINEQISEASNLLIGSTSTKSLISDNTNLLNSNSFSDNAVINDDNSDLSLFSKLFHSCRCHFALLLTNEEKRSRSVITEKGKSNVYVESEPDQSYKLFGRKAINLILNNDGFLSSSDLLALHLSFKLGFHCPQVNIFVNSSTNSSATTKGFDEQIEKLMSINSDVDLSIHHIKDNGNIAEYIVKTRPTVSEELMLIANNLGKGDEDILFVKSVNESIGVCVTEGVDILVVKSAKE